ncbi:MAG: phage Gp37/Gp68 family protein [Desulfovibrio sp.]|jgi:protein gp37|nr:phage Gp37/Gp68 family protein [Desulfovibrio sp.]
MSKTKIEWCDFTINPVVGCSHCSPGCDNCYAERFAARLVQHPNPAISGKYSAVVGADGKWNGKIYSDARDMKIPSAKRVGPKRIFIGSMCDMFHPSLSWVARDHILYTIGQHPAHTFIFLTKRAELMQEAMSRPKYLTDDGQPLPNLWLGVTVCNQQEANEKIPILLQTPAAKRGVCVEPMLGPVDLEAVSFTHSPGFFGSALRWHHLPHCRRAELADGAVYPHLDWVIAGGESGPGARPMHPNWVRSLRDQCQEAGVPFFFKGWGEYITVESIGRDDRYEDIPLRLRSSGIDVKSILKKKGGYLKKGTKDWCEIAPGLRGQACPVGKRRAGRLLDGREWNEAPS